MRYQNVSIVVPVFNGSTTLPLLVKRIQSALENVCELFQLILVDDGSQDETWKTIALLAAQFQWITGIKLLHNMGQHAATLTGLRYVCYPVSVIMDDDLQHPPEAIPQLLAALDSDVDIVYAAPKPSFSSYRILTKLAKYGLALASGAEFMRHIQSFRALRTSLYPWSYIAITQGIGFDGLLKYVRPRVRVIRISYAPNMANNSRYTFTHSVKFMFLLWRSIFKQPQFFQEDDKWVAERIGQISLPMLKV